MLRIEWGYASVNLDEIKSKIQAKQITHFNIDTNVIIRKYYGFDNKPRSSIIKSFYVRLKSHLSG